MFHRSTSPGCLVVLVSLVLVSVSSTADAGLVAWWKMNDEGTGTVIDSSGNGHDGTLNGDAQFVQGIDHEAMEFDGAGDYITMPGYKGVVGDGSSSAAFTISAWIRASGNGVIVGWGGGGDYNRMEFRVNDDRLRFECGGGNVQGDTVVSDGQWHHVAVTVPESAQYVDVTIYVDGANDTQSENDTDDIHPIAEEDVHIGRRYNGASSRDYLGLIDDVQIYDSVLTLEQIQELAVPAAANNPEPADDADYEDVFATLTWEPGYDAVSHDVYFGTSFDDVQAGAGGTFVGNQTDPWLLVGITGTPFPDGLVPGTRYYWRVDEINEANPESPWKGQVWSFFVASLKAYSPDPVNGEINVDPDVTLSWLPGKDAILHTVYFGESLEDVESQIGGTAQAEMTFDPGELENDKRYYWRVDETTGSGTVKGDVWDFKTIPAVGVSDPNLMGWWKLDEESSDVAVDWSGHGNHGLLVDNPLRVPGYDGGALNFNDINTRVALPIQLSGGGISEVTVCAWVRTTTSGAQAIVSFDNNEYWRFQISGPAAGAGQVGFVIYTDDDEAAEVGSTSRVDDGEWHHVAGVFDNGQMMVWIDGIPDAMPVESGSTYGRDRNARYGFIGSQSEADSFNQNAGITNVFDGDIDDVRIYDVALDQAGMKKAMRGDPRLAWGEEPTNETTVDFRETTELGWSAGDFAAEHDVYLGSDPNAVADADTDSPEYRGRQSGTMFSLAGLVDIAGGPYYWRIDEVNTDATITKGRIWEFTIAEYLIIDDIEDYDNYDPNRVFDTWIDGWGNSANGSIIGYPAPDFVAGEDFVETGVVHGGGQSMPFFYDNNMKYSEATRALAPPNRDWTQFGVKSLALWFYGHPAPMGSFTEGPAGTYTMVATGSNIYNDADEFGFAWKMLSGEGSITARVDSVQNTADDAKPGLMLRDSLDPNSVTAIVFYRPDGGVRYNRRTDPAGTTGGDNPGGTYPLPQWLKIDRDFSGNVTAYHANDVGGAAGEWNLINTVQVQMSTNIYIGLAYTSSVAYTAGTAVFSNVSTTGNVTGDQFTYQEIGIQYNAAESMYVSITDGAGESDTVTHPDIEAALTNAWTEWPIALSEFDGVDLTNVDSMSIGFGTKGNTQPGGSGLVFFDDFRLYAPRCFPDIVKPAADFSNDCVVGMADLEILTDDWLMSSYDLTAAAASDANLVLHYQFEGNAQDSSGNGNHGTVSGATFAAGKVGQALSLDGVDDRVAIANLSYATTGITEITVATWIRTDNENAQSIASFDRSEYWRLQVANNVGLGKAGWSVMTNGGQVDLGSKTSVDDGQWHHVTGVFDNGAVVIYIDGKIDASTVGGSVMGTGASRFGFVGAQSEASVFDGDTGPLNNFDGEIDDFRIYDRAVPQAEIANLAGVAAGSTLTQPVYGLLSTDGDSDLVDDERIDFMDYAALLDAWLDEMLWPQ